MRIQLLSALLTWTLSQGLQAQTNPSAVALPFNLNSQSTSTLPSGVAVHRFSSIPTFRTTAAATGGDLPNQGSSPTGTAGGWYHLGTDGIGLLASGTNPAGAVIVAINTTGLTDIEVSWVCKTIRNQASRDNSIALQYRVGTSGSFINVGTGTTYSSAGQSNGHSSGTLTETLPVGAENQSVVQVRWIYWESVSISGSRDKISVDDISISGTAALPCDSPLTLTVSDITDTGAFFNWPSVSGAAGYEYAINTSATPPGSGSNITDTFYRATNLNALTAYYFHVRTNCGSSYSGWSSISFQTDSAELDTTLAEDFVLMTYNLLNYPGSNPGLREPAYRTVIQAADPDILVIQELSQVAGAARFRDSVMNYTSSTYSLGTVIDGPDSDRGIYYRSSLFQFISNTPISTSLRDINTFRLKHIPSGDTLIIFGVHLKASNTGADQAQRAAEVDSLRQVTDNLAAGSYFIVCGDFNIYGAGESAYTKLLQNGANADGKFNDLINLSGTWNNSSYAIHHTQSPRTTSFGGGATGGLDDRFDMILFSTAITQAGGFDIVSNTYKSFGNDGQHYNQALNTSPYTLYDSTLQAAIHDASDHLPVVVTLTHTTASMKRSLTGIQDTRQPESNWLVYPNPAGEELHIKLSIPVTKMQELQLYDASGKLVFSSWLNQEGETRLSLKPLHLATGQYTLMIPGLALKTTLLIQ